MNQRETTLLAYAVAEYATVLGSMEALRAVDVPVPYVVIGRIQSELNGMCLRWQMAHGEAVRRDPSWIVAECRTYLTEHGDELERVTSRE